MIWEDSQEDCSNSECTLHLTPTFNIYIMLGKDSGLHDKCIHRFPITQLRQNKFPLSLRRTGKNRHTFCTTHGFPIQGTTRKKNIYCAVQWDPMGNVWHCMPAFTLSYIRAFNQRHMSRAYISDKRLERCVHSA